MVRDIANRERVQMEIDLDELADFDEGKFFLTENSNLQIDFIFL